MIEAILVVNGRSGRVVEELASKANLICRGTRANSLDRADCGLVGVNGSETSCNVSLVVVEDVASAEVKTAWFQVESLIRKSTEVPVRTW